MLCSDVPDHAVFKSYQSYFNWIKNLTEDEAENMISIAQSKFKDTISDRNLSGTEVISNKSMEAYLCLRLNKPTESKECITEAKVLISRYRRIKFMTRKYVSGLLYVVKGVEMLQLWLEEVVDKPSVLEQIVLGIQPFESLTKESQVGVLAMKNYYLGRCQKQSEERCRILKLLKNMDPDRYEWPYCLYNVIRFDRRLRNYQSSPDRSEIRNILLANRLDPDHPLVMVGLCVCVGEFFKNDIYQNSTTFEEELHKAKGVVNYLKNKREKILIVGDENVDVNVSLASIYMSLLPYKYRDFDFAKRCIEKALILNPRSSKANHRRGILYLKENSETDALHCFGLALEFDKRNFPALQDLLLLYLKDTLKYGTEISETFNNYLDRPEFTMHQSAQLYFLKGISCAIALKNQDAVKYWIMAHNKNPKSLFTSNMNYYYKRYQWKRTAFSLKTAHQLLSDSVATETDSGKVRSIQQILALVQGRMEDENTQSRNRGRPRNSERYHERDLKDFRNNNSYLFNQLGIDLVTSSTETVTVPPVHEYRSWGRGTVRNARGRGVDRVSNVERNEDLSSTVESEHTFRRHHQPRLNEHFRMEVENKQRSRNRGSPRNRERYHERDPTDLCNNNSYSFNQLGSDLVTSSTETVTVPPVHEYRSWGRGTVRNARGRGVDRASNVERNEDLSSTVESEYTFRRHHQPRLNDQFPPFVCRGGGRRRSTFDHLHP